MKQKTLETNSDQQIKALEAKIAALETALQQSQNEKNKIAETNHYLETIMGSMPGNIYWIHANGQYQFCNDNNARYLNLTHRDEVKGKTQYDVLPPEIATATVANDLKVIETGQTFIDEEFGYDQSHQRQSVFLTTKAPLYDKTGQIIGIFGVALDITERKKMETELTFAKSQAEIASEAKSEFIANMSHDLRTPFSGILGFAHQLYNQETDPQKKQELGYIVQSAKKLLDLLNDILQSSKDGASQQFISTTFDLVKLAEETKILFMAEVERKNISFKISSLTPTVYIRSDRHRIHRILINLASNAVKFTSQGEIQISITPDQKQNMICIQVSDTGIGIPTDAHNAIFERFTRLSSTYQGKYVGTGIGLWLVKKFIEDLDGTISVQSRLNKGSVFSCEIPVEFVNERQDVSSLSPNASSLSNPINTTLPKSEVPESTADLSQQIQKPLSILMVEDDEVTRLMQASLLHSCHYQVDMAHNGQAALQLANTKLYDLILMDIGLPDLDGFTLSAQIKQPRQLNQNTPIIGLTAHISQYAQANWQDAAINKLIVKPLTPSMCQQMPIWLKEL